MIALPWLFMICTGIILMILANGMLRSSAPSGGQGWQAWMMGDPRSYHWKNRHWFRHRGYYVQITGVLLALTGIVMIVLSLDT